MEAVRWGLQAREATSAFSTASSRGELMPEPDVGGTENMKYRRDQNLDTRIVRKRQQTETATVAEI
jgi:hypothetical protein